MEEENNPSGRRLGNLTIVGVMVVCLLSAFILFFIRPRNVGKELTSVASVPTEEVTRELPPTKTPRPTDTPELTRTPKPTLIVFKTTVADDLYDDLVLYLDDSTIERVNIVGRDLHIRTHLYRSDINIFYEEIGTIHGVVVNKNPDIDRMILKDVTGQQIIIPMSALVSFSNDRNWDAFRATWTVINP